MTGSVDFWEDKWADKWDDPVRAREIIEALKAVLEYNEAGFFFFPLEDKTIFLCAEAGPTRDGYALIRTDPKVRGMYEASMKEAMDYPGDHWMLMAEADFISFAEFVLSSARDRDRKAGITGKVLGSLHSGFWANKAKSSELPPEHPPLPEPDVDPSNGLGKFPELTTMDTARALLSNPLNVGIAEYGPNIDEETWVRMAAGLMRRDGVEQWLVNMIHSLRGCLER